MKVRQSEWRNNGKRNMFPELVPGLSIVYRVNLHPAKGKIERIMTFRIYIGMGNRQTVHFNRSNYKEKYNECVKRIVDAGLLSAERAAQYEGVPTWKEILIRYGLKEKCRHVFIIVEPDEWEDPQLNLIGQRSEHKPRKRKRK